jgi:hypothetical protein
MFGPERPGPVPPLTEAQISAMLREIERDPENRRDYEKLVEFWRRRNA